MPTTRARTLSISIDRPWREVYAYASDPRNLHHWAAGLGEGFERDGEMWTFRDPGGNPVRMHFTPPNEFADFGAWLTVQQATKSGEWRATEAANHYQRQRQRWYVAFLFHGEDTYGSDYNFAPRGVF